MRTVMTLGTFDLFHRGHLSILRRSLELGDRLIVGVATDRYVRDEKGVIPVYSQDDRLELISRIVYVKGAYLFDSFDQLPEMLEFYTVDILTMGSDWEGKLDRYLSICKVIYLPRTTGISSTELRELVSLPNMVTS